MGQSISRRPHAPVPPAACQPPAVRTGCAHASPRCRSMHKSLRSMEPRVTCDGGRSPGWWCGGIPDLYRSRPGRGHRQVRRARGAQPDPRRPRPFAQRSCLHEKKLVHPRLYFGYYQPAVNGPTAPGLYRQCRWAARWSGAQVSGMARGTTRAVAALLVEARGGSRWYTQRRPPQTRRGLIGRPSAVPVQPAESHAPPGGGGGAITHTPPPPLGIFYRRARCACGRTSPPCTTSICAAATTTWQYRHVCFT